MAEQKDQISIGQVLSLCIQAERDEHKHSKKMQEFFNFLYEFTEKVPNAFTLDMEGRIRMSEQTVMKVFDIPQKTGPGTPLSVICAYLTGEFHGLGDNAAAKTLKLSKRAMSLIVAASDLSKHTEWSSRWHRIIRNRHLVGTTKRWQMLVDSYDIAAVRSVLLSICGIKCELAVRDSRQGK